MLTVGLVLSVGMMGIAAGLIARLLERYRWIAWVGLLIVLYVAMNVIWHGWNEVADAMQPCLTKISRARRSPTLVLPGTGSRAG